MDKIKTVFMFLAFTTIVFFIEAIIYQGIQEKFPQDRLGTIPFDWSFFMFGMTLVLWGIICYLLFSKSSKKYKKRGKL